MVFPSSIYEHQFYTVFLTLLSAIIGASIASFVTCITSRIKAEASINARSHCESCGHVLGILDLIPIVSWILMRGRCRYCKAKIPASCLITELVMAIMFAIAILARDLSSATIGIWVACTFLLFVWMMLPPHPKFTNKPKGK